VGDPLAFSPKHRITLTATYTLPLDESMGKVSFGGTWVYTAKQLSTRGAAPQFQIFPSTNQFNLNFDWKGVGGSPMDLAVFVTNVTNEAILVGDNSSYQLGFDGLSYAPPRMFGMRVRVNFGP
jgi:iron complex outermembrane receptor protein